MYVKPNVCILGVQASGAVEQYNTSSVEARASAGQVAVTNGHSSNGHGG